MELNKKNMRGFMLLIVFAIAVHAIFRNPDIITNVFGWIYAVISPVVLGAIIAFVLNILLRFFDNKVFAGLDKSSRPAVVKLKRPLSLIASLAAAILVIVLIVNVIFPQIGDTLKMIGDAFIKFFPQVLEWVEELMISWDISVDELKEIELNWDKIQQTVVDWVKNGSMSAVNIATSLSTSIFGMLFNFILAFIIAIYFLLQKEEIIGAINMCAKAYMKEKNYKYAVKVAKLSNTSLSNFVTGQLLEAVILGSLCFVGMLIFKFPYASVVSVLVGVTALIPMFGAWIGGGISAVLILMVDPMKALLFLVFIVVLQQLEGNLIYPRVVGQSMGLPGLLVLLSVVIGGNLFGVVGILISVPLCSVVYALVKESVAGRLGLELTEQKPEDEKKEKKEKEEKRKNSDKGRNKKGTKKK